ncbi:GDSL-type esterase/lipase family protein [Kineococcus vitellinus]|uniref:GDSL-type esterase/lipase family protein n=1 Tax=Kineococcus vitellinus TaxID=2696565 RepID=UPI00196AABD1
MSVRWIHTWTAAQQRALPADLPTDLPAAHGPGWALAGVTLRQTVRCSLGGPRVRLRLSNAFGEAPLAVVRARVAAPRGGRAGARAVEGAVLPVTFGGRPGTDVPPGALVVSDPVELPVAAGDHLSATLAFAAGTDPVGTTSHPGSRTTSHVVPGDRVDEGDLPGAAPVEHWYVLTGVEVPAGPGAGAVVLLGDSLTDGRGSTTDGADRWSDRLLERLLAAGAAGTAVLNQGIGGNRVLADGVGPSALARLERDVLALGGVRTLVVLEGVNDLGAAAAAPGAQRAAAARLLEGYRQVALRCRAHGIAVVGATLLPFGGHDGYDDPGGSREAARQQVNARLRAGAPFDALVDLDAVLRDPARPSRLRADVDGGDHLHLSPAGYAALAAAVPLELLTGRVEPS